MLIITVLAQPEAVGHPLRGMMVALNAISGGYLVGQENLGGRKAEVSYDGIESAAAITIRFVSAIRLCFMNRPSCFGAT
ncbi:MAG: hypothetical protein LBI74_05800 [Synergistaceae bacterium]|jgi:hypothetical protein|nr:hypothetical protein [Synergistaceae bacterium]